MKFKRFGLVLGEMCVALILTFGCLIYSIVDQAGIKMFIICLGAVLFYLLTVYDRSLFYDTVYCDEKGIKVVTREKTTEISWNEVSKVERIVGRGGRMDGWTIAAVSGENVSIFPFDLVVKKRFKNYMQSKLPHLEIK